MVCGKPDVFSSHAGCIHRVLIMWHPRTSQGCQGESDSVMMRRWYDDATALRQCRSATVKRVDCVRGAFRVTPCVCLTEAHNRLHGASDSLIVSQIQSFVLSWPLYSLCPKLWWRRNNRSRVFAVGCKRVTEGVPGWIEGLRLAPGPAPVIGRASESELKGEMATICGMR